MRPLSLLDLFTPCSIQTHVEKAFENVARSTGHKCVLLCDRGGMDGSAYIDRELFCDIVRVKTLEEEIRSYSSLRKLEVIFQ